MGGCGWREWGYLQPWCNWGTAGLSLPLKGAGAVGGAAPESGGDELVQVHLSVITCV